MLASELLQALLAERGQVNLHTTPVVPTRDALHPTRHLTPGDQGYEKRVKERLDYWRALFEQAQKE